MAKPVRLQYEVTALSQNENLQYKASVCTLKTRSEGLEKCFCSEYGIMKTQYRPSGQTHPLSFQLAPCHTSPLTTGMLNTIHIFLQNARASLNLPHGAHFIILTTQFNGVSTTTGIKDIRTGPLNFF